jgi:mono/diheme cytochrome c family protein
MKTNTPFTRSAIKLTSLFVGLSFVFCMMSCNQGPPENSRAGQAMRGKVLFEKHCLECHGENSTRAAELSVVPPDLTKINDRWGGKFPVVQIARMIDGRQNVQAHGERDMPVWGEVFKQEGDLNEDEIKGKLGELVAYLISIQK